MKTIETKHAPAALGPYSQAKKVGNLVFLSGQIGINPETGKLAEGLEAQAEQVCANIEAVLKKAGADMEAVVKTTCFLTVWKISQLSMKFTEAFHQQARQKLCVCPGSPCRGAL